jgi:hypothetical protein
MAMVVLNRCVALSDSVNKLLAWRHLSVLECKFRHAHASLPACCNVCAMGVEVVRAARER